MSKKKRRPATLAIASRIAHALFRCALEAPLAADVIIKGEANAVQSACQAKALFTIALHAGFGL
jgi:hypothetical protein